jgi:DNA-binding response OmpR family regulator
MRILLVEDDVMIGEALRNNLPCPWRKLQSTYCAQRTTQAEHSLQGFLDIS